MTVKELREALAGFPDDWPVVVPGFPRTDPVSRVTEDEDEDQVLILREIS